MAIERLPFSDFKSFSRLFSTYAGEFDPLASFFAGDFRDPRQRGQIALQVADQFELREELVEILTGQNERFGAGDATHRNIQRLLDPTSVAVVTGQQLGLFTGPLYTILKAVTTIQLARRIESDTGRPAIPVFWLEGEDHDFAEVASTSLFQGNRLLTLSYDGAQNHPDTYPYPVGRLEFSESIISVIDRLEEALPPTDFRGDVLEAVREAYKPGITFLDAFVRLMGRFFEGEGLVFATGDDPRIKRIAIPLFRKELKEHKQSAKMLGETSRKLEDSYHSQVRSEPVNLFLIIDNGRRSLQADGDGFTLKGTDLRYTLDDLLTLLDEKPETFSPNVVFRPLVQDTILPTAAYVAGPSEVAYFAQFRPLYEWAGIPMPIIYPRASVTLVEPKIKKVLQYFGSSITVFEQQLEQLFREMVLERMIIDPIETFDRASLHLQDAVDSVKSTIENIDPSLGKATEATRVALLSEWTKLKERTIKAEKRKQNHMRERLSKAQSNLYPNNSLQERIISPLYFFNKYGIDLVKRFTEEIELDTTSHQIFSL